VTKTIAKVGNSQGLIFDAALMDLAHLKVGDQVNVTLHEGGAIVLTPVRRAIEPQRAAALGGQAGFQPSSGHSAKGGGWVKKVLSRSLVDCSRWLSSMRPRSASLRWVTSRNATTAPIILPDSPSNGEAV